MTDEEIKRKKLNEDISKIEKLTEQLEKTGKMLPADYQGPESDNELSSDDSLMQDSRGGGLFSNVRVSMVEDTLGVTQIASNESLLMTQMSDNSMAIMNQSHYQHSDEKNSIVSLIKNGKLESVYR